MEQTWNYVDYDDEEDSSDDAAQRDLNVYAGTMCAAPEDGATTAGAPVLVLTSPSSVSSEPEARCRMGRRSN